jgi:hypothetical protein
MQHLEMEGVDRPTPKVINTSGFYFQRHYDSLKSKGIVIRVRGI